MTHMFNWFRRLFSDATSTDSERSIFRYWNGSRWDWAPPLVVPRGVRGGCPHLADPVR